MSQDYLADAAEDVYSLPEPDRIPDNPAQLEAWDLENCLLVAEWEAFWRMVGEHEREQAKRHGPSYRGIRRDEATRAFRKLLRQRYAATDPSDAWLAFDDERRRNLKRDPRPIFKSHYTDR